MNNEYPVEALMDRYCFYRQKYVICRGDVIIQPKKGYTSKQVWAHLNGNMSLCVFAGPSNTTFLTLDVDIKEADTVHHIIDTMCELCIPREKIYVSDSGGKGYHIDIYFAESIRNWLAKELYELIIYFGELNRRKIEYRPNHTQAIKLPLGIHQKTGFRCWFVDRETLEPIKSFEYIETTEKIEAWRIEDIVKAGNKRRFYRMLEEIKGAERQGARRQRRTRGETVLSEEGTRQRCMIEEALRLYRAGGTYGSIHNDLIAWLGRQDERLYKDSWEECIRNIDNITGWVMKYGRQQDGGEEWSEPAVPRATARIYESDAKRIIEGSTKTARLLAFLFTVFCDRYEFCGLGVDRMMGMLGVASKVTLVNASKDIVGKKLFYKTQGGYKYVRNSMRLVTNKYRFPNDYERSGRYIEVAGDDIYDMYIEAMAALVGEDELRGHVTAGELKDIKGRVIKNENHCHDADGA